MRGHRAAAAVLAVVGGLFLLLWLQSPSRTQWTGIAVTGHSDGGVVYYAYDGQQGSLLDPDRPATDHSGAVVTVYLDRSRPTDSALAQVERVTKWTDAVLVLGWFVAAGAVLVAGVSGRRPWRLRRRGGRRGRSSGRRSAP